jgi:hypothetical protein
MADAKRRRDGGGHKSPEVGACSSSTNEDDALSKLDTAHSRATKARDAEAEGKTSTAFDWWDKVFFDHVPAY